MANVRRKLRRKVCYALAVLAVVSAAAIFTISVLSGPGKNHETNTILPPASQVPQISSSETASSSPPAFDGTIIIDPGHGGPDPGATGVGGVIEKDLNLAISKKLQSAFQKDGNFIIMTRDEDLSIYDPGCITLGEMKDSDLNNRIKIIKAHPKSIFISIHQNYNDNPTYSGTQVYYSENNPGSKKLAKLIQAEVKKDLQPGNKRDIQPPGVLRVLLQSPIPAVLIECGFITNTDEAHNLENSDYQDKLAADIEKATKTFISTNFSTAH